MLRKLHAQLRSYTVQLGQTSYARIPPHGEAPLDGDRAPPKRALLLVLVAVPAAMLGLVIGLLTGSSFAGTSSMAAAPLARPLPYFEPALNRFLTPDQCEETYPGLNREAERSSKYWLDRGGITEAQLQAAQDGAGVHALRVVIVNNRVRSLRL
jgi:hypothetical protein